MIASNEQWVVPADMDVRRFLMLEVNESKARNTKYFAAIERELQNGGREAFLYDLLNYDLGGVDLRNPPKSDALLSQKITGFPAQG